MSRNRYTRLIHDRDEARLGRQHRDLARIARSLRSQNNKAIKPLELPELPELPAGSGAKARRRVRLEQKQLHKTTRPAAVSS
jgi:hypothetical protein